MANPSTALRRLADWCDQHADVLELVDEIRVGASESKDTSTQSVTFVEVDAPTATAIVANLGGYWYAAGGDAALFQIDDVYLRIDLAQPGWTQPPPVSAQAVIDAAEVTP